MNRDCQLISEAYQKINKNSYYLPQAPKFQVGDYVLIKEYITTSYTGTPGEFDNSKDWESKITYNVLGKVIKIKLYQHTYYYDVNIVDKRYPIFCKNRFTPVFATHELKKTKLTEQDTDNMVNILDI